MTKPDDNSIDSDPHLDIGFLDLSKANINEILKMPDDVIGNALRRLLENNDKVQEIIAAFQSYSS